MTDHEPKSEAVLRVLVVDDSAYNRQTITAMLESRPGVKVVGRAVNGKEALKLVFDLDPDAITLDLEMPEMDGFSFLRLLMSKRPTPVLVISGYSQRDNVFRALELGALDFIAKPGRHISPDIREIADDLAAKVAMVRRLQSVRLKARAEQLARTRSTASRAREAAATAAEAPASEPIPDDPTERLVVIGASTGGPPAIQQLLMGLGEDFGAAVLIAQHMPARFTRAFAQRLDRVIPLRVVEAVDGMPLARGVVYVAPGQCNLGVRRDDDGRAFASVETAKSTDAGPLITPSADHLFSSAAAAFGDETCAAILTGMGSDGTRGAADIKRAGGLLVVEDPQTAVMPGMPHSAFAAGHVDEVASLDGLALHLRHFAVKGAAR